MTTITTGTLPVWVSDGRWHYLAALSDGETTTVYIDGVRQG